VKYHLNCFQENTICTYNLFDHTCQLTRMVLYCTGHAVLIHWKFVFKRWTISHSEGKT